jgi:hypothetical protein
VPYKMENASPELLSSLVFAAAAAAENKTRMRIPKYIRILDALGYAGQAGLRDPEKIAQFVRAIDPSGTLDIAGFRRALEAMDTYLRSLGYDDLETRLAVNVLDAPPPVQRVEVPVVAAGPRLTDPVPNTTATYGDLADAFSPQQEESAQLQGPQCMEVHRVARKLKNFTRGMNILTGAVRADPRFTQYMINPGRLVAGEDGYERVSDGDRTALMTFIEQKMMSWLERSDIGAFRDPARRRLLVEGLLGELRTNHLPVNIQGYYAGTLMIAVVLFMDTALREYPTMQTTWAETVVRDGIEAYGEDINTYDPEERPHISCPNGIIERFFIGLAGIIVGSAPDTRAARAPVAPAPAAPAPAAQAPVYNPGAGMPPPVPVPAPAPVAPAPVYNPGAGMPPPVIYPGRLFLRNAAAGNDVLVGVGPEGLNNGARVAIGNRQTRQQSGTFTIGNPGGTKRLMVDTPQGQMQVVGSYNVLGRGGGTRRRKGRRLSRRPTRNPLH